MQTTILFLVLILVPFLPSLSLADELAFPNSKEWLSEFRGKWSVCYFFEDSFSTDVHESPVQFVDGRCHVEIADGPIKTFMLYYNDDLVSRLEKDQNGKWHVPKLSQLVFSCKHDGSNEVRIVHFKPNDQYCLLRYFTVIYNDRRQVSSRFGTLAAEGIPQCFHEPQFLGPGQSHRHFLNAHAGV